MRNLAFVGGGMMAEAIIRGVVTKKFLAGRQVSSASRCRPAARLLRRGMASGPSPATPKPSTGADVIVLAVKPQYAAPAMESLAGRLPGASLLISIMAGITIKQIAETTRHRAIVRVMPNTPAQYGEAMSAWTATPEVSTEQADDVRALLSALGRQVNVATERYIDMATALSGSGPGFVLLFIEALVDAGVHLGFSRPIAEELAIQTVLGTAVMARESGQHLAILRNAVTSPGGTTAAGLQELEDGRLRAVVNRAIAAAYERCVELGK